MFASFWKWLKGLFGFDDSLAPVPTGNAHTGAVAAWQFQYSPGMSAFRGAFTFPNKDGVHYAVRSAPKIAVGNTITLRYKIDGSGSLVPVQAPPAGQPPQTHIRLYMQRRGDTLTADEPNKRWWSLPPVDLTTGEFSLSAVVDKSMWSNVNGQSGTYKDVPAGAFEDCVANLQAVGFTFGGNTDAGHGVYATGGTMTFTVLEFSVH